MVTLQVAKNLRRANFSGLDYSIVNKELRYFLKLFHMVTVDNRLKIVSDTKIYSYFICINGIQPRTEVILEIWMSWILNMHKLIVHYSLIITSPNN